MAVQAKWNIKTFEVSHKKVLPITGFTTSYKMRSDTNDDTSGTKKTNTRGRAPEEPSFQVKYLAAAGASPRNEFTEWRKLVGKKDYLYIGNTMYGVNKFELSSADVSDVVLDNKGRTLQAVVTLHFIEDLPTKKKSTAKTSSSSKLKSNSKGSKTQAKSAKASKTDKKLKSPYGTGKKKTGTVRGRR